MSKFAGVHPEVQRLMNEFPGSFINSSMELILFSEGNIYTALGNTISEKDMYYRIISSLSRDAFKCHDLGLRKATRQGLNRFFGKRWSEDKWRSIYTLYGNGQNQLEGRQWVHDTFFKDNKTVIFECMGCHRHLWMISKPGKSEDYTCPYCGAVIGVRTYKTKPNIKLTRRDL